MQKEKREFMPDADIKFVPEIERLHISLVCHSHALIVKANEEQISFAPWMDFHTPHRKHINLSTISFPSLIENQQ